MRFNNFNYRNVLGDEKYNSSLVTSLINKVMRHGKKEKAKRHVYESLKIIESELKKDPIEVLSQAIKNLSPSLENKSRKRGGVTLQIPFETSERRKQSLSLY
jgi:small subunit ribosomal protein S7